MSDNPYIMHFVYNKVRPVSWSRWSAVDRKGEVWTREEKLSDMRTHFALRKMHRGPHPDKKQWPQDHVSTFQSLLDTPDFKLPVWWAAIPTAYDLTVRYFGPLSIEEAEYFLWSVTPYPFSSYGDSLDGAIRRMHERSGGSIARAVELSHEDLHRCMEEANRWLRQE